MKILGTEYNFDVDTVKGCGGITTDLKEQLDLGFFHPEMSGFCDGIESLILALACAGVNVWTTQFGEAIDTAIEAGLNELT